MPLDLLSEAYQLVERGVRLRAQLQARREELVEELGRIDAALTALPLPSDEGMQPVAIDPNQLSVPDVALLVLTDTDTWLKVGEIRERAAAIGRADIAPEMMHSALYRLSKAGRVQARGPRGSREYHSLQNGEVSP